jgi:hypothetical protein
MFLFAGVVVGALARDLGSVLRFQRDWSTIDRTLNWDSVEAQMSSSREGEV